MGLFCMRRLGPILNNNKAGSNPWKTKLKGASKQKDYSVSQLHQPNRQQLYTDTPGSKLWRIR